MSEQRCPNCRHPLAVAGSACTRCGWVPLQSTELQFLDTTDVACPDCKRPRPADADRCPYCGSRHVLGRPSSGAATFHLSTLLATITWLAFCLALCRLALVLGILLLLATGLSALRTATLVRERKKHRYPIAPKDVGALIALSFFGVLVGSFVFVLLTAATGFAVAMFFSLFPWSANHEILTIFFLCLLNATLAWILNWRRVAQRTMIWWGMLWGIASCVPFVPAFLLCPPHFVVGFAPLTMLAAGFGAIHLCCYRGGVLRAKSFLTGFAAGLCVSSGFFMQMFRSEVAVTFAMCTFPLLPALLTIEALNSIWSWDDAFPGARSSATATPSAASAVRAQPLSITRRSALLGRLRLQDRGTEAGETLPIMPIRQGTPKRTLLCAGHRT